MNAYVTNIERDTLTNEDYRRVLITGTNRELVVMTLRPGEEIAIEAHDQFIRAEAGGCFVQLDANGDP